MDVNRFSSIAVKQEVKFFKHRKCLLIFSFSASVAFAYDLGVTYNYKYETSVVVDEDCKDGSKDLVGHSLRADVHLTNIWQDPKNSRIKLVRIKVIMNAILL